MARTRITIVLDLDETTDCPAGSARIPGGPAREFHGWLGLTEAIDALTRSPVSLAPAHRHEAGTDDGSIRTTPVV